MAPHSSTLAWRIPGTEEPSGLPSMGSHRVGHDWSGLAISNILTILLNDTRNLEHHNFAYSFFCSAFFKSCFLNPTELIDTILHSHHLHRFIPPCAPSYISDLHLKFPSFSWNTAFRISLIKVTARRHIPGGPMVKTPSFQGWRCWFYPWSGN